MSSCMPNVDAVCETMHPLVYAVPAFAATAFENGTNKIRPFRGTRMISLRDEAFTLLRTTELRRRIGSGVAIGSISAIGLSLLLAGTRNYNKMLCHEISLQTAIMDTLPELGIGVAANLIGISVGTYVSAFSISAPALAGVCTAVAISLLLGYAI